jgi:FAD/FMN-containing dehydrogenase
MQKVIDRLKSVLMGEISTDPADLDYYSTDGGIFKITPSVIVFPKDAVDVITLVKIINEEARNGRVIPVTARGRGTDQGGGPLNSGIIVDFTRHMNQILEIGPDFVRVEPGCRYGELQAELKRRGRYIPVYPASVEICAIGGAVANNSAGEKTVKYGATRDFVQSLKVVLSNGEHITTASLDSYGLVAKKRMDSFEGDVYRKLSSLVSENHDFIKSEKPHVTKNAAGYALWELEKYGKFDLAQLLIGSQGTLGLHTEIVLKTVPFPKKLLLMVGYFDEVSKAGLAVKELLHLKPSALEVVDINLIQMVLKQNPDLLKGLLPKQLPALVLLAEFDDQGPGVQDKKEKIATKILEQYTYEWRKKSDPEEQARLWKLRRSAAAVMWTIPGKKKALPIIEDAVVHPALLSQFFARAYELFEKHELTIAVWGHAGDANLHMQPFMDLSKESERKKIYKVTDEFYAMIADLGGSTSAEHNDSLMRSPYLPLIFDAKMIKMFEKVKKIFDPHAIFNPHKKVNVDKNFAKSHIRREYSIKSLQKREQVNR